MLFRYLSRTQSNTKRLGANKVRVLSLSSACNGRTHILNSVAGSSSWSCCKHCNQSEDDTVPPLSIWIIGKDWQFYLLITKIASNWSMIQWIRSKLFTIFSPNLVRSTHLAPNLPTHWSTFRQNQSDRVIGDNSVYEFSFIGLFRSSLMLLSIVFSSFIPISWLLSIPNKILLLWGLGYCTWLFL